MYDVNLGLSQAHYVLLSQAHYVLLFIKKLLKIPFMCTFSLIYHVDFQILPKIFFIFIIYHYISPHLYIELYIHIFSVYIPSLYIYHFIFFSREDIDIFGPQKPRYCSYHKDKLKTLTTNCFIINKGARGESPLSILNFIHRQQCYSSKKKSVE